MSESKTAKAIRLLKETPFEFIDYGEKRETLPQGFEAPEGGDDHWTEATAVFATLRSRPATWQWTAPRLRGHAKFSDRKIRKGVGTLKRAGWVQHVNVYDSERTLLTTLLLVFNEPIPVSQRTGRYSMVHSHEGWRFRAPGGNYQTRSGVGSRTADLSVHMPYGHYKTMEKEPKPLKRACSFFSSEAEGEKVENPQDSSPAPQELETPPPPPQETVPTPGTALQDQRISPTPQVPETAAPAKQRPEIENRKHLVKRLRQLGEKRDQSDDDALLFEEFVTETFFPALELPPLPEEGRKRSKQWALRWVEENLLGMLLKELSCSTSWDVTVARRVIRKCNDGYITFPDLRVLIMAFRWNTRRSSSPNLRKMTHYGPHQDPMNMGQTEHLDYWGEMIKAHRDDYKHAIVGSLRHDCGQIHPDEEMMMAVNHATFQRTCDKVKQIFTGKIIPDERSSFRLSMMGEDALAYMLSSKGRSEKTERLIADAHDELIRWMATDYTGILVFRGFLGRLEEDMGIHPDEVRKAHHKHIDYLTRRASCHGIESRHLVPLI